ncbi:S8 family serine peptidase [Patescibacteria group bacterium]|nr:S8 family serine peptidase [Patescibacteria group bacterium]
MKKILITFFILIFLATPSLSLALEPNDSYYDRQWYLEKINAPGAWERSTGSQEIVVAVIDAGVQINHPDLKNNIWKNEKEIADNGIDDDKNGFIDDVYGWDFVGNNNNPSPDFNKTWTEGGLSHGTIVSGIIAAQGNNKEGVAGISWKSKIMPLRVLNDSGAGSMRDVIRAVDYAIQNGAHIINFSFVGENYSQGLQEAINRAHDAGVLVVAAAGNENSNDIGYNIDEVPLYPVCHDGDDNMVIGVSATDALDQKAEFSSYGKNCIDISAPGVSFFGTVASNPGFDRNQFSELYDGYWSGTSMAAPVISGSLALILSINPTITKEEATDILMSSTDDIRKLNLDYLGKLGRGRVNVSRAVDISWLKLSSQKPYIITSSHKNNEPRVYIRDIKGVELSSFLAYSDNFKGGVNIGSGDVDGNGVNEIVTGAKSDGGAHIRVFNIEGELKSQFFAFDKNLRNGVNIAVGDVNKDGVDEIITTLDSGNSSEIRVYDFKGNLISNFNAYDNMNISVNIAVGDINGNGRDEIVSSTKAGSGPQIRVFDMNGNLISQFFAYDKHSRTGVKVAIADIDSLRDRNKEEIITAPGPGLESEIKIFNEGAQIKSKFLAYAPKFKEGVSISVGDINADGFADIITGAGPGGAPHVRVYNNKGKVLQGFYAGEASNDLGVDVSYISIRK